MRRGLFMYGASVLLMSTEAMAGDTATYVLRKGSEVLVNFSHSGPLCSGDASRFVFPYELNDDLMTVSVVCKEGRAQMLEAQTWIWTDGQPNVSLQAVNIVDGRAELPLKSGGGASVSLEVR